eukprot:COSAG01_NODE_25007_length_758_cov_5.174507_1_plen_32_part_01
MQPFGSGQQGMGRGGAQVPMTPMVPQVMAATP